MRACKKTVLVGLLTVIIALGFPAQVAASARCRAQPGLSLEAISITRIKDNSVRWLSLLEIADLVSVLRQATPYVEAKDAPWQYCIALVTERGAVNCYYSTDEGLICFPPYTHVLRVHEQAADFIDVLFNR